MIDDRTRAVALGEPGYSFSPSSDRNLLSVNVGYGIATGAANAQPYRRECGAGDAGPVFVPLVAAIRFKTIRSIWKQTLI